uniref:Uncharacterized protein n=1 Tax=Anguilla anguilla TaxID=7936 RepID=A0A0E9XWY2_ANGAN
MVRFCLGFSSHAQEHVSNVS